MPANPISLCGQTGVGRKLARDVERVRILFLDQQQPMRVTAVGLETEPLLDQEIRGLDPNCARRRAVRPRPAEAASASRRQASGARASGSMHFLKKHDRLCGNALGAAKRAQSLGRRRLDVDAIA